MFDILKMRYLTKTVYDRPYNVISSVILVKHPTCKSQLSNNKTFVLYICTAS